MLVLVQVDLEVDPNLSNAFHALCPREAAGSGLLHVSNKSRNDAEKYAKYMILRLDKHISDRTYLLV